MTDTDDDALEAIRVAAERLIPELTERLRVHGLGEIEVAHGDLRLRVAATPGVTSPVVATGRAAAAQPAPTPQSGSTTAEKTAGTVGVASPAVGFFVYADGLGPGLEVAKGDELGHVEMLGVRHDVRAPRGGTVRHLVAESGEAVEYGQVVLELQAAEAAR
jgi:acetyl-CoA carboxylase biotin carboxyl carrier protein